ncbi:MAG: leucyl aminopeptidase, partial [Lachnospiraceae bacterium]|nr:leucyl aminopeptidase [Lachnospiraceae bacterium]
MEYEEMKERYLLMKERIAQIQTEESVKQPYLDYFRKVAVFMAKLQETFEMAELGKLSEESLEAAKERNRYFYQDILEENYGTGYANPEYAVEKLGEEFGGILSFLYAELRGCIGYAYEKRLEELTIFCELFVEIYGIFAEEQPDKREVEQTIYWFFHDYSEIFVERNV